ncbi:MAG: hypothetical protein IJU65_00995, partial [Desulfovibrio sp.]|nr:hypothetical protein [Desulfovibrio sp.]
IINDGASCFLFRHIQLLVLKLNISYLSNYINMLFHFYCASVSVLIYACPRYAVARTKKQAAHDCRKRLILLAYGGEGGI